MEETTWSEKSCRAKGCLFDGMAGKLAMDPQYWHDLHACKISVQEQFQEEKTKEFLKEFGKHVSRSI